MKAVPWKKRERRLGQAKGKEFDENGLIAEYQTRGEFGTKSWHQLVRNFE
jgi:hypothetical protein